MIPRHRLLHCAPLACLPLVLGQQCNFSLDPGGTLQMLEFTATPDDLSLDCAAADNADTLADWLDSAKADTTGGCGPVTVTHDFTGLSETCDASGWHTIVTWTAEDACGDMVQTVATLTIVDPNPPVIALNGDDPVVMATGTGPYEDAGATVSLGCGTVEADAVVGGDVVDTTTRGTYEVTYDATDACGNAAQQITRAVIVVDPPEFTVAPADLDLSCAAPSADADLDAWLDSAEAQADPFCGQVAITQEIVGLADTCSPPGWALQVRWTAVDDCGLTSTTTATLTLLDTPDPTIALVGDEMVTLECGTEYEELGALVMFDCADVTLPAQVGGHIVDPVTPGTYIVTYQLADDCGHATDELMRTVEVVDTMPPEVVLKDDDIELWPPNHQYETLSLADCIESIEDACEGELSVEDAAMIVAISSDEPENANGDGNTENDIVIVDDTTFMLRAERRGGGNGRVYTIDFVVSDSSGNTKEESCTITVPHDQSGGSAGDDGPSYTVTP